MNDHDVAASNVAAMDEFARTSNLPIEHYSLQQSAYDLISEDRTEVAQETLNAIATKILMLAITHRKEWEGFVSGLPESSWVKHYRIVRA